MIRAIWQRTFKDTRPEWEIRREREFIQAANRLKTLRVTPRGGMSIDPEEFRDQISLLAKSTSIKCTDIKADPVR